MTRATVAIVSAGLACAAVAISAQAVSPMPDRTAQQTTSPAAPQDKFPEGPGREALLKVCSNCHSPESVLGQLRTRQEWSDVIDQMAQFGAQASDQEFQQVLDYLVKNFSPIRVNKATAKDLEAALDVPAPLAGAIVSYRQEKGDFKSPDDLKKVPGLDAAKIDARKDRLVF